MSVFIWICSEDPDKEILSVSRSRKHDLYLQIDSGKFILIVEHINYSVVFLSCHNLIKAKYL